MFYKESKFRKKEFFFSFFVGGGGGVERGAE